MCLLGALMVGPCARGAFFLPLGDLPGGYFSSSASDVSADGKVVVGWSVARPSSTGWPVGILDAFRWTPDEGMVSLGRLEGHSGSLASAVSADGSVVVGTSLLGASSGEPFRWASTTGMQPLDTRSIGNFVGGDASAVSADGSVVVGANHNGFFFGGPRPAFRWTAEGTVDLGDLPGGDAVARAEDVSADGSVIVGWSSTGVSSLYTEAFRWTRESGMVGLGNLVGGEVDSFARGVSADGSVIVGYSDASANSDDREAFRWTSAGGMVGLGDLPGGRRFSSAEDVSADGAIVVGQGESAIGPEAVLWDATHGLRRVTDRLTELGLDLSGWTLSAAWAISADGTTIVGNGINPSGQTEAWLANITAVPEPSALGLAGIGLLAGAASRGARVRAVRHARPSVSRRRSAGARRWVASQQVCCGRAART
ncbi:MAG: PEP-CTERM sorting domain-containing protein [Planctomycetota bacterium]|nr:MAG: PEP-CTERM sorting domain-containing protein [Planctomycetota bacterium]